MDVERGDSEIRHGMRIEWDVPIPMDDGIELRADVYRPVDEEAVPAILSHGAYGKWLRFDQHKGPQWRRLTEKHPLVEASSSNTFQNWETVDPELWVPDGYAVVRVDSRGAGRSPGFMDPWSPQETRDFAQCIEWAGTRPWSNGRVGLNGISYYAINQWQVAALQPAHLEAICVWEGAADLYRDLFYHGGILADFGEKWYDRWMLTTQHGLGTNGYRSAINGNWPYGPETLSDEELSSNRVDLPADIRSNRLASAEYWTSRKPDFSEIDVPLLSAANWGGHVRHARGNFEGYMRSSSEEKWLEVHGGTHFEHFYTDYGRDLQKRFFGHFLQGEDTGWDEQPPVQLQVRHPGEEFSERHETDWPIPRTNWTRRYLHAEGPRLSAAEADRTGSVTYDALGEGVTFLSDAIDESLEITGPISATLFISSDTVDADLFVVLRVFHPDLEEIVFQGQGDPHKTIALGWLRASHRKTDSELSRDWRPYHTHDEEQRLEPGEVYEVEVELWPTSIVVPAGSRIGFSVRGNDYEYPGDLDYDPESLEATRGYYGAGSTSHNHPRDRPESIYGGEVSIRTGPQHPSSVLLPIIPE